MPSSLHRFLLRATQSVAGDLVSAVERLPEDKRNWSPMGDARSALDQAAECAILNGGTANLISTRSWDEKHDMEAYLAQKAALVGQGWDAIKALLHENTSKATAAIESIPEADFAAEVNMPWGPMTLEQIASYPYWNMCYHEGQINYIASMIGCLN